MADIVKKNKMLSFISKYFWLFSLSLLEAQGDFSQILSVRPCWTSGGESYNIMGAPLLTAPPGVLPLLLVQHWASCNSVQLQFILSYLVSVPVVGFACESLSTLVSHDSLYSPVSPNLGQRFALFPLFCTQKNCWLFTFRMEW